MPFDSTMTHNSKVDDWRQIFGFLLNSRWVRLTTILLYFIVNLLVCNKWHTCEIMFLRERDITPDVLPSSLSFLSRPESDLCFSLDAITIVKYPFTSTRSIAMILESLQNHDGNGDCKAMLLLFRNFRFIGKNSQSADSERSNQNFCLPLISLNSTKFSKNLKSKLQKCRQCREIFKNSSANGEGLSEFLGAPAPKLSRSCYPCPSGISLTRFKKAVACVPNPGSYAFRWWNKRTRFFVEKMDFS